VTALRSTTKRKEGKTDRLGGLSLGPGLLLESDLGTLLGLDTLGLLEGGSDSSGGDLSVLVVAASVRPWEHRSKETPSNEVEQGMSEMDWEGSKRVRKALVSGREDQRGRRSKGGATAYVMTALQEDIAKDGMRVG
jgi:hypothetical protein